MIGLSLLLIIVNVIVSWKGFNDRNFYERYEFSIEKIRIYKQYYRLITSGFLHVNWMHLIFNMIALYFFAGSVEYFFGPFQFLLVYFVSMIGGDLLSLFIHRHDSGYSSVGASGAVNGIIFAAIAVFPGMKMFFGIPAWIFGLAYVLYSIYGIRSRRNNIGHDAHLGGALIGLIVAIIMHPSVVITNTWPIVIIMLPSVVFMYIIITRPHSLLIDNYYFNKHSNAATIDHKYNIEKRSKEQEIDRILEKIHKKGMKSLTDKERQMLQEYSR